jgi:hypothetical protein
MLWMRSLCLVVIRLLVGLGPLLFLLAQVRSIVDVVEARDQVGQHEHVRIVRVEEGAAPLAQVGFVRGSSMLK